MFKNVLFFSFLAITMSGCFSLTTYQTADTLDEGELEVGLAVNTYISEEIIENASENDNNSDDDSSEISLPNFDYLANPELIVRYGVKENLDLGLKIVGFLMPATELDLKYRFLSIGNDSNRFSMAIKPLVGVIYNDASKVANFKTGISLLTSKKLNKNISLYLSGSYNAFFSSNKENDEDNNSEIDHQYVATLGTSIDFKYFWLRPELAVLIKEEPLFIPGIATGFKF